MRNLQPVLGIDVGSASVSAVEVTPEGAVARWEYELHRGSIDETLRAILHRFDPARLGGIAATASARPLAFASRRYDGRVSVIKAADRFHRDCRSILIVGAERFGLIELDEGGACRRFRFNSGCAAGTGSFLEQQAERLRLGGAAELSELACRNTGPIPRVASRCAVFAKTDLAHAQQEGYSLEAICDGLCSGLARNIVDTVFGGREPRGPVLLSGGVAKNRAVVRHLASLLGVELEVEELPTGAAGAALCLLEEGTGQDLGSDRAAEGHSEEKLYYGPILLDPSRNPRFGGLRSHLHEAGDASNPVEIEEYEDLGRVESPAAYLGVDVGSTSTKAVLLTPDRRVLAGFYTRTAGRPIRAVQRILESIDHPARRWGGELRILGVASTGAGRKFAGAILGADLVLDEITAHARAAYELNPSVDTIIEIGGQDSKFTTIQNGRVTFAVMNTVCAAGTGSFIEEQAEKLGCPLAEYASRAEGRRSPLTSDRCTVFMERDLNHYLAEGCEVDELLASVLHSVVENYLTKVAVESSIGQTVAFQGATAKNRALVVVLEERLGKPLFVSRYCHLTGALGAALKLCESGVVPTSFKGLGLHRSEIPLAFEICELCPNHCKITVAEVGTEKVAYGFLCGRDYDTRKRVSRNRSGFDLLKARADAFRVRRCDGYRRDVTVGLPAALHLFEDLPFWETFFEELSIRTVTSERSQGALQLGKPLAGAEFCAPVTALHGHVSDLLTRSDFVFLPFYLERPSGSREVRRQYCYYTGYAPSLAGSASGGDGRVLSPLIHYLYGERRAKRELHRALQAIPGAPVGLAEVSSAYERAAAFQESGLAALKAAYRREAGTGDLHVVLLGRPYAVLSAAMNKGIPEIFGALGVKAFFQDMLSSPAEGARAVEAVLQEAHWLYAARILEAAEVTARTENAYPVLVTSFKCSPDSFVMEYFRKVMAEHGKPYLILQLDEHASGVGYETRIEAALESFRSHRSSPGERGRPRRSAVLAPSRASTVRGKTLVLPNWDPLSQTLIVAALKRAGVDARLPEGTETGIRRSLRHNSGQCLPLNIIAEQFADCILAHDLDPARTVLWMGASKISCNLGLYPYHLQNLLAAYGKGLERAQVYVGGLSLGDISLRLPVETYLAYLFGGLLKRLGCKVRPYERVAGSTDEVLRNSLAVLEQAFLGNRSKKDALAEVIRSFEAVERRPGASAEDRPKVAIFGDLYARDNDLVNQGLIHFIEANGGEVVTTPFSSYLRMIARPYLRKWLVEGDYLGVVSSQALLGVIRYLDHVYYGYFDRILREPRPVYDTPPEQILSAYGVRIEHTGESMDNLLKVFYLKHHHPEIALFVQASPAFCCPALVTEAMAGEIERHTGTPVVSITYDGAGGEKNDVLIPYLAKAKEGARKTPEPTRKEGAR